MPYLPDELLVIIFTRLSTSTDSKEDPEWYSRPTRRPLAVTYLIACEGVCTQWKNFLRSPRMNNAWSDMLKTDFNSFVPHPPCRNRYMTLFFHSYKSRAARSTLNNIDVFSDAASATSAFDPSWTYNVFFEARQKGTNQLWPLISVGGWEWSPYQSAIELFSVDTLRMRHAFHNMRYTAYFPESRSVVLEHESAEYTNDYVPTPGLEGAVYIGRSDGRRALLGRFDSTLIGKSGDERDGRTDDYSPDPEWYCAPVFVQPLVRSIFFGAREYTLTLRVEVQYERRHPEKGGWFSDVELELVPKQYPDLLLHRQEMSPSRVKDAFMKALVDKLQWHV